MDKIIPKAQALEVGSFLVKLNLLLVPFYAVVYFNVSLFALQELYAKFIALVLSALSFHATASGVLVFLGREGFPINISFDCLGWKSSYSLFALIFATPGDVKGKLRFLKFWVPAFAFINFARIMTTVLIGYSFGFKFIEPVHTYIWQAGMIGIVVGVWLIWLKRKN